METGARRTWDQQSSAALHPSLLSVLEAQGQATPLWVRVLETPGSFSLHGETVCGAGAEHSSANRVGKGSVREGQTDR